MFGAVAHDLVHSLWTPGVGVRLLGVGVSGFDEVAEQLSLLQDDEATGAQDAPRRTGKLVRGLDAVRERFGDKLFRTVIRQSIAYAESAERAVPILDYRPDRGSDYLSLAGEILRRLGKPELLERLDELSAEVVPA